MADLNEMYGLVPGTVGYMAEADEDGDMTWTARTLAARLIARVSPALSSPALAWGAGGGVPGQSEVDGGSEP